MSLVPQSGTRSLQTVKAAYSVNKMERLVESGLVRPEDMANLLDEANQLLAISVSSIKTAKSNK